MKKLKVLSLILAVLMIVPMIPVIAIATSADGDGFPEGMPTTLPGVGEATCWTGVGLAGGISTDKNSENTLKPAGLNGATITAFEKIGETVTLPDNQPDTTAAEYDPEMKNVINVAANKNAGMFAGVMVKITSVTPIEGQSFNGGGMTASLTYDGVEYVTDGYRYNNAAGVHAFPFTYVGGLLPEYTEGNGAEVGSWYYENSVNKIRTHAGLTDSWIFLPISSFAAYVDGKTVYLSDAYGAKQDGVFTAMSIGGVNWGTSITEVGEVDLVWVPRELTLADVVLPGTGVLRWNGGVSGNPGDDFGGETCVPEGAGIPAAYAGKKPDFIKNIIDFLAEGAADKAFMIYDDMLGIDPVKGLGLQADTALQTSSGSTGDCFTIAIETEAKLDANDVGVLFTLSETSGTHGPGQFFTIMIGENEFSSIGQYAYSYISEKNVWYASHENKARFSAHEVVPFVFIPLNQFKCTMKIDDENVTVTLDAYLAENGEQAIDEFRIYQALGWKDQGVAYVKSIDVTSFKPEFTKNDLVLPELEVLRWNGGVWGNPGDDFDGESFVPVESGIDAKFAGKKPDAFKNIINFLAEGAMDNVEYAFENNLPFDPEKGLGLAVSQALTDETKGGDQLSIFITTEATLSVNDAGILFSITQSTGTHGPGQYFIIIIDGEEFSSVGQYAYSYLIDDDVWYATHEGKARFSAHEVVPYVFIPLNQFKGIAGNLVDYLAENGESAIEELRIVQACSWTGQGEAYVSSIDIATVTPTEKVASVVPTLYKNSIDLTFYTVDVDADELLTFYVGEDEYEIEGEETEKGVAFTIPGLALSADLTIETTLPCGTEFSYSLAEYATHISENEDDTIANIGIALGAVLGLELGDIEAPDPTQSSTSGTASDDFAIQGAYGNDDGYLCIVFTAASLENLQLRVTINDNSTYIDADDFGFDGKVYSALFGNFTMADLSLAFDATLMVNEEEAGQTFIWKLADALEVDDSYHCLACALANYLAD